MPFPFRKALKRRSETFRGAVLSPEFIERGLGNKADQDFLSVVTLAVLKLQSSGVAAVAILVTGTDDGEELL